MNEEKNNPPTALSLPLLEEDISLPQQLSLLPRLRPSIPAAAQIEIPKELIYELVSAIPMQNNGTGTNSRIPQLALTTAAMLGFWMRVFDRLLSDAGTSCSIMVYNM